MKSKPDKISNNNVVINEGNHFTIDDIIKFNQTSVEQEMIRRFGLFCPVCSTEMLKNFCPDCGQKTVIPNFCHKCKNEIYSQFCGNCGSSIFLEGENHEKFLQSLKNEYAAQLNQLISLLSTSSDYQERLFSLIEVVIQVLSEIKKEISQQTKQPNKIFEKLEEIDSSINRHQEAIEDSSTNLNNRILTIEKNLLTNIESIKSEVSSMEDSLAESIDFIDTIDQRDFKELISNINLEFNNNTATVKIIQEKVNQIFNGINYILKVGYDARLSK